MFNPFTLNTETTDPVLEEVLRLGINMPSMKETLRGDIDLRLFLKQERSNSLQQTTRTIKKS